MDFEGNEDKQVETGKQLVDSAVIDDFRRALLHRSPDVQLAALNSFLDLVKGRNDDELREFLVKNGVVESLGESINSLNVPLVRTSLFLLEELMSTKGFVSPSRAVPIVRSILRSVLLFAELSEDGVVVQQGLDIVSKIIMTLVLEGLEFNEFCDLDQLINVCQTILRVSKENLDILRPVTQIVYTVLLRSDALLQEGGSSKELSFRHLVAELLNLLCRHTHESPHLDIDTSICEVGAACMRFFLKANGNQNVLEPIHALIRAAMTKLIIPHVKDQMTRMDVDNFAAALTLLKGIISLYHYPDPLEKLKYTKLLVENDFLLILQSMEQFCRTWVEFVAVRSLMVEILTCLSANELGGEHSQWRSMVSQALKSLPAQGSLSRLETHSFAEPISSTIIIFHYFVLTGSTNPNMNIDLFQDICTYMNAQKSRFSGPLFKAVWFCFTVGYLLHGNDCYIAERANNGLSSQVDHYDLGSIYTHHPAVLTWTFRCENLSRDFKSGVLDLWVSRDEEMTYNELKTLLSESREGFMVYLELLSKRCTTESDITRYLRILPDVQALCDDLYMKSVAYDAWSLLPSVILNALFCADNYRAVPLFIFCTEYQPESIDQDLVVKIACMLPGLLSKRVCSSDERIPTALSPLEYFAVFKLLCILVNNVEEKNEGMILRPLLHSDEFIRALEFGLSSDDEELTIVVLELLSMLLFLTKTTTSCPKSVILPGSRLSRLLYERVGIVTATVKMLHRLLTADDLAFSSRLLVTIENPLDHLRVWYSRLHNIAFSGSDELASWCWICCHRLLKFSLDSPPLGQHLASLPYTHVLIRECEPDSLSWFAMMEFVPDWLSCQPQPGGEMALSSLALDETLIRLAQLQASLEPTPENSQTEVTNEE